MPIFVKLKCGDITSAWPATKYAAKALVNLDPLTISSLRVHVHDLLDSMLCKNSQQVHIDASLHKNTWACRDKTAGNKYAHLGQSRICPYHLVVKKSLPKYSHSHNYRAGPRSFISRFQSHQRRVFFPESHLAWHPHYS